MKPFVLAAVVLSLLRFSVFPAETTLVWISVDGFRADYLDRAPADGFFAESMKTGMVSRHFLPVFPSITFPSHVSEATGVPVSAHGIANNSFYDAGTKLTYKFPSDASLLLAEPIWLTAKRQNVRTEVLDWPLSQAEQGAVKADYFNAKFEHLTNAERMERVLDTYKNDAGETPLRLVMGYMEGTDTPGHRAGPASAEVIAAIAEVDGLLKRFCERFLAAWKEKPGDHGALYLMVTTDHGMMDISNFFNLKKLLAPIVGKAAVTLLTAGPLANIHLDLIPAGEDRDALQAKIVAALKPYDFLRVYKRGEMPAKWSYEIPQRTGDLIVLLPNGYTFDAGAPEIVTPHAQFAGGSIGMHGYPVEENAQMEGVTVIRRFPEPLKKHDADVVKWDQLHPTAAKLLEIEPAAGAKGTALDVE
ncbi:MAG: ectonucleotide pyrophosphatase/phosphodiesterase family er 5 [Chthoniobacter sp.]|jgi:predicted AlkP superfamily pyrophosphatase or phosphodiesterase|nr:ectonucleotide pyrophosphatase/phosphodiesterase family er 5 [Chthoniobacter sp.]